MSRLLSISIPISIPLGAAGALALTLFGCGGIGGGDALFDSGSAGAGGAPMSTSVTTGSTADTTSTTGDTSATSATSSATTSVSSSATTASASSSSGGVVETLDCGGTTCPLGNQNACCWSKFGMPMASGVCVQGPPDSDGCKTFVAQDGLQTRLECQTSAQCNQGTCCGHRTLFNGQNFFYDLVSCADTCAASDVTLCDPTNPADVCPKVNTQGGPVQGVCKQSSSLPPGYFVCVAPG
jgi:hypothetical protein